LGRGLWRHYDVDSLKQLVAAFTALNNKTLEIEKLKVQLLRLRRIAVRLLVGEAGGREA
jgi:hypothetical protein